LNNHHHFRAIIAGEVIQLKGGTHLIISGATTYLTQGIVPAAGFYTLGCIVGTLLPDCDYSKSFAGKVFPVWIFSKHRGFMHSYLSCFTLAILSNFFDKNFAAGFFLGYFMHLFCDQFTKMHLPYAWWPVRYTNIRIVK
jgi:inner membrane protein